MTLVCVLRSMMVTVKLTRQPASRVRVKFILGILYAELYLHVPPAITCAGSPTCGIAYMQYLGFEETPVNLSM